MVKNVVCLTEMPVVSLRQDIYVITEGSHLTIPCEFTGAPISNVTWERRNDIIRWSHRQSESLNLTLRNVSRDMAGIIHAVWPWITKEHTPTPKL